MPPVTATAEIAGIESTQARPGLVRRPRLVRRFLEAPAVPLVLLVATTGFGKTTLLDEWADRDARPFVWVTLDDGDNDAGRLIATVGHALDSIDPAEDVVVVVEHAHALREPRGWRAIAGLLDRLPAGSQLALTSRTEPALPTGRLRAHRKLIEVRSAELEMTQSEAAALLEMAGLSLDSAQVATLVRRTEGWPAGLYLAALAVRDQPDAGKAVARFAGNDRLVADYLHDELLSHTPRGQLEFLMRTSVLDRLSGPLCDALVGRRDSARTLAELARSNLLIQPLDRANEWYRYHTLLAGTLLGELRRLEPGRERELNLAASSWHEDHGDPERAIAHAVAAHDPERLGELLLHQLGRYVLGAPNGNVAGWLATFRDDELATAPALALVAAGLQLTAGDGNRLRHWATLAGTGQGLESGAAVMRSLMGTRGLREMADLARQAGRSEPEDSPWRSVCCLAEGVARQLSDDPGGARLLLEEGAQRGTVAAPIVQALCLAQLTLLAYDSGDLESADAFASRALRQAERLGLGDRPIAASLFAASALVRAARGRVADAMADVRHSRRLLEELTDFAPWYEAEVRIALAHAALRLSEVRTAETLLAEAARLVRHMPDAVSLKRGLDDLRVQLEAARDSARDEGWAMTTAELRVLQFLPSHLSFPAVADRLYVSPNTIKTHARAVYRKLGASSRAEAVVNAREAGLLDGSIRDAA